MATFEHFSSPRFPSEIRDMIWNLAIQEVPPRLIELHGGVKDKLPMPDGEMIHATYGFVSRASVPSVLHACSRSRELATSRWKLTFASKYQLESQDQEKYSHVELKAIPRTWFDFEKDTLVFCENNGYPPNRNNATIPSLNNEIDLHTRSKIRNVAFNDRAIAEHKAQFMEIMRSSPGTSPYIGYHKWMAGVFYTVFPCVKKLQIVAGEDFIPDHLSRGLVIYDPWQRQNYEDLSGEEGFWEGVMRVLKPAFLSRYPGGEVSIECVKIAN